MLALSRLLTQDALPLAVVFGLFGAAALSTARDPRTSSATMPPTAGGWRPVLRHLVRLIASGYVVFVAIVAVFYVGFGNRHGAFLARAAVEGAVFALAVVVPALLGLTWLHATFTRRSRS